MRRLDSPANLIALLLGALVYGACAQVLEPLQAESGAEHLGTLTGGLAGSLAAVLVLDQIGRRGAHGATGRGTLFPLLALMGFSLLAVLSALRAVHPTAVSMAAEGLPERALVLESLSDRLEQGEAFVEQGTVSPGHFTILGDRKAVVYAVPSSRVSYALLVSPGSRLGFSMALAPDVWRLGRGDGVEFDVYVQDAGEPTLVFSEYIDPKNTAADRVWHERELDLAPWARHAITLTLATSPGPNGNAAYDWAGWGEPRIFKPAAYDLLKNLGRAEQVSAGGQRARAARLTIDGQTRVVLLQCAPGQVIYDLGVPPSAALYFGLGAHPDLQFGDPGSGPTYSVYVVLPGEPHVLHQVFRRQPDPARNAADRQWMDETVALGAYAEKEVRIIFEASPGGTARESDPCGGWSLPLLAANDAPFGEHLPGRGQGE